MRLLFARVGHPHCPKCGRPIERQTVQQIVDAVSSLPQDSRIMVMAPKVRRRKGEHKDVFEDARKAGFVRVRVNGTIHQLEDMGDLSLDKKKWHYIEVVVDRLIVGDGMELSRVADSVETALRHGDGVVLVDVEGGEELVFSEHFSCVHCGVSLPEIEPRTFSFNSPHGACPACTGLGFKLEVDPDLVIQNKNLSLAEGAIVPWMRSGSSSGWYQSLIESVARAHGFSTKDPVRLLPEWAPGPAAVRKQRRNRYHASQDSGGSRVQLGYHLRRSHLQPGATPQGDRVGLHEERDRAVHGGAAMHYVRREAASSRGPCRPDLRNGDHGRLRPHDGERPPVGRADRSRGSARASTTR